MKTLIIIPSRMSAKRLPGKPLLKINGLSIISQVAKKAEEASNKFGWNFDLTIIPTDKLVEDFKRLASKYDCRKKTQFENTFAYMYMFPKIKEKYVAMGMGVDIWYGSSKKVALHYKEPKSKFDAWRKEYFDQDTPPDLMTLKALSKVKYKLYGYSLKPNTNPSIFKILQLSKRIHKQEYANILNKKGWKYYPIKPEVVGIKIHSSEYS